MQYTIRSVPEHVDRELRRRASEQHKSLNTVILETLEEVCREGGTQDEVMLERQCGNPDVVGRDGCPLLFQLLHELGVAMRRRIVRIEDADPGLVEKSLECLFIL